MACKKQGDRAFAEDASLDISQLLDLEMFVFWKKRFEVFVKSKSLRLWRIIEFGDYIPHKVSPHEYGMIVKQEWELSYEDETKVQENYLAIHLLYRAIPDKAFGNIFKCDTAHDIWKTLDMIHEGNSQLKDYKINILTQQLDTFHTLPDESIDSMFRRFTLIISNLKALGKTFTKEDYLWKIRMALPSKYFQEYKNLMVSFPDKSILELSNLSVQYLEDLMGDLKVNEMTDDLENKEI